MKKNLLIPFSFLILCFCMHPGMVFSQAPAFDWAKRIGGTSNDNGNAIALDVSGNLYITGLFQGTVDFDPDSTGTYFLTSGGSFSVFISKFDSLGHFIWTKAMGGSGGYISGLSLALDVSGNVYTSGYFYGTVDLNPDAGILNATSNGGDDIFISKLDNSGNFVWAKTIGGTGTDVVNGMAMDSVGSGGLYITGNFQGTVDFNPDATGTFYLNSAGNDDIFVSKFDTSGNLIWAKAMGGTANDRGTSITVDPSAARYVYSTGYFQGTADFDPGAGGTFHLTSAGNYDIFISKLDSAGNFIWAKAMGGTNDDEANSIAVDPSGNGAVYTTGFFYQSADFDPGIATYILNSAQVSDIFISKLDSAGNFAWAKSIYGGGYDMGLAVALDHFGHVYTTGFFSDTADFDPGAGTFHLGSAGSGNIFISKLDTSGNFVWAKAMNGTGFDQGNSIAADASGKVYITGAFTSPSLQFNTDSLTNADNTSSTYDILLASLASCSAYFTVYADTVPHNWFAVNHASGSGLLTYSWDWGDGNSSTSASPSHTYSVPGNYNICLTINDAAGCTSTYCDSSTYLYKDNGNNTVITISVLPQTITGIIEMNKEAVPVSTLPNPFTHEITMKGTTAKGEIFIYDISGKEILRQKTMTDETKINTAFISRGFYLLQYIEENKSAHFKMTKF
ncbi:MAG: PKD domain-containing protein [Bacteroidetes bacterium]|nr:PKD domain-containing protein [Bacteroidota bacterium]